MQEARSALIRHSESGTKFVYDAIIEIVQGVIKLAS